MHSFLAIDLGATNTRLGMISENGNLKKQITLKTPREGASASVISNFLIETIELFLSRDDLSKIEGIGISAAGPVDTASGTLINPPNIPFHDIPLVEPLTETFKLPVHLVNDCHAGVLGEAFFGSARGIGNVVYITISTGIGGGVILNNRLPMGRGGNVAEIGHFTVDTTYNLKCGCGHLGHWEGYASGRYIPQFFTKWCELNNCSPKHYTYTRSADIFHLAKSSDPVVLRFIDELGRINGRGLSNVIVAYDPEILILDGSVVLNNEAYVLSPMLKFIDRFLPLPKITTSHLRGLAPLLGASIVAKGYETSLGQVKVG